MPEPAPPSEYDFLFKVAAGRRPRYEVVTAASASAAVDQLRAAGCADIVALVDDAGRHRFKSRLAATMTPEAYAHALTDSPREALVRALLATMRKQWYVQIIFLAIIILFLLIPSAPKPYIFIIALLVPYIALVARFFSGGMHRRLQRLVVAARWADVAELAAKYQESAASRLPRSDAAKTTLYFQTRALPKIGRLREAHELVERRRGRADFPDHLYWRFRGLAFVHAGADADAIACLREAVAADGDDVASRLQLADLLTREPATRGEAAGILTVIRERPLTAATAAEVDFVDGTLALESGRWADAIAAFERALAVLETAARRTPLYLVHAWALRGRLAIARARGGDAAVGRREFEAVRGKLELHGERRVLEQFAAAAGVP